MKTQKEIRAAFWAEHKNHFPQSYGLRKYGRRQNQFSVDVRMAFVDFVDYLQKSGQISEVLAERVTL